METTNTVFAGRLCKLMSAAELSQREVARGTGISNATMCRYIQDARCPSSENAVKLAKYFGVSTDYILGLSDKPGRTDDTVSVSELLEYCWKAAQTAFTLREKGKSALLKDDLSPSVHGAMVKSIEYFADQYCMWEYDIPNAITRVASNPNWRDEFNEKSDGGEE